MEKSILDKADRQAPNTFRALNDSLPPEDRKTGLDLINASDLTVLKDGQFIWGDPAIIGTTLKVRQADIPSNRNEWVGYIHPEDRRDYQSAVGSLKWDHARYAIRYRVKSTDKTWVTVEDVAERLPSESDVHIRSVIKNVSSETEDETRQLWRLRHDDVTGLPNAQTFAELSDISVALARRIDGAGTIYRLRLDNLATINHVYGPEAETQILKSVAARLNEIVRVPDCLGKDSGTDFLLTVMGISGKDSDPDILATRLKKALTGQSYITPFGRIKVEFSISFSAFPQGLAGADEIIRQTAWAMGAAEKNTITAYTPDMAQDTSQKDQTITEADIRRALTDQRIALAYQPIIETATGDLHHYECLLRIRHEDGSFESAWRLILAAEKLGLVQLLDQRALDLASQALRDDPTLKLALNVSAETVKSEDMAKDYLKSLEFLGPKASQIILELTETAALNDPAKAGEFSNAARQLGCEFAIDDFGSGHTSFQNLMAIEAETIKIDGSLIKGISKSPHMQNFVRMMVDMARTFSVKTVAEMVEDYADAVLLRRLGVDYLQGYLFGMPGETPQFKPTDFLK